MSYISSGNPVRYVTFQSVTLTCTVDAYNKTPPLLAIYLHTTFNTISIQHHLDLSLFLYLPSQSFHSPLGMSWITHLIWRSVSQWVARKQTTKTTKNANTWALRKFSQRFKTTTFAMCWGSFEEIPYDRLNYVLKRFLIDISPNLKMKTVYCVIVALNRCLKSQSLDQDLFTTKRYEHFRNVLDG